MGGSGTFSEGLIYMALQACAEITRYICKKTRVLNSSGCTKTSALLKILASTDLALRFKFWGSVP